QHAQLARREQAIGHGHAQHRRMALDVQPVAQPQRTELILRQAAIEETPRLVAELADALGYEGGVDFVIAVHGGTLIDVAAASRPEPVIMTCGEVIWQWRPLQAGLQPVVRRPSAMPLTLAGRRRLRSGCCCR